VLDLLKETDKFRYKPAKTHKKNTKLNVEIGEPLLKDINHFQRLIGKLIT
jgi:hypothetical protein